MHAAGSSRSTAVPHCNPVAGHAWTDSTGGTATVNGFDILRQPDGAVMPLLGRRHLSRIEWRDLFGYPLESPMPFRWTTVLPSLSST